MMRTVAQGIPSCVWQNPSHASVALRIDVHWLQTLNA